MKSTYTLQASVIAIALFSANAWAQQASAPSSKVGEMKSEVKVSGDVKQL